MDPLLLAIAPNDNIAFPVKAAVSVARHKKAMVFQESRGTGCRLEMTPVHICRDHPIVIRHKGHPFFPSILVEKDSIFRQGEYRHPFRLRAGGKKEKKNDWKEERILSHLRRALRIVRKKHIPIPGSGWGPMSVEGSSGSGL